MMNFHGGVTLLVLQYLAIAMCSIVSYLVALGFPNELFYVSPFYHFFFRSATKNQYPQPYDDAIQLFTTINHVDTKTACVSCYVVLVFPHCRVVTYPTNNNTCPCYPYNDNAKQQQHYSSSFSSCCF